MSFESNSALPLTSIKLAVRAEPHTFEPEITAEIEANWAAVSAQNPSFFNGSAFLFDRVEINEAAGTLSAECAPTDYATFLFWRRNRDRLPLRHIFAVGAIVTADQKLVVGRMSRYTVNPGRLYPPAGSFDASDVVIDANGSASLDPVANIGRELKEEIGVDIATLQPVPNFFLLPSSAGSFGLIRVLRSSQTAHEMQAGLLRHVAEDPHQELDDVLFLDFSTRLAEDVTVPYVNHLLAYLASTV